MFFPAACAKCRWIFASTFCTVLLLILCFPSVVVRIFQTEHASDGSSITVGDQLMDLSANYHYMLPTCTNNSSGDVQKRRFYSRGNYTVVSKYRKAERTYSCLDSVTLCTHGDPSFLKNLPSLALRWRGPISMSLFAPRPLLQFAIDGVDWLLNCSPESTKNEIRSNVTFHLITDVSETELATLETKNPKKPSCSSRPSPEDVPDDRIRPLVTFYPINVARNVAAEESSTHFIFNADIELYPSENFIQNFLSMINSEPQVFLTNATRQVFVLPIFEISKNSQLPQTKSELVDLYVRGHAVSFHKFICEACHKIPELLVWLFVSGKGRFGDQMKVFSVVKRKGAQRYWEPIYVATKNEPGYDERLGWSGGSDKMMQMFELCAMDYDFKILNNAFLVHKPGIKKTMPKERILAKNDEKTLEIKQEIKKELLAKYGENTGCEIVL